MNQPSNEEILAIAHDRVGPHLGLATTRELLLELKTRGECEHRYHDIGNEIAMGAAELLRTMPGSMLDYRTIDSH